MNENTKIVIAGAGTGKTYTLVQTYVEYLKNYRPFQLLAITFTQKAAAEMRARVISKVQELGLEARGLLSAPISTFHALCAQIVGDELGEFDMLTPVDDERLCVEIAEQVILEELSKDKLQVGQLVARFQIRSMGDAKGLSETLVYLLQDIREQGLEVSEILVPEAEFSDLSKYLAKIKAALENFQNTKLTNSAKLKLENFEQAFSVFCALKKQNEVTLSAAFRDMRTALSGSFGSKEHRINLLGTVLELGAFLCRVYAGPDARTVRNLLVAYSQKLDAYKKENKSFGFSDLLYLSKRILSNQSNQKKRFECVLVDEYQDTSPIQEQIVKLLSKESKLFVVGDPKQSIYGFRGADASVFERLEGERSTLNISRRSQGAVIDLVNLVARATLDNFNENESLEKLIESHDVAGGMLGERWAENIKDWIQSEKYNPNDIVILVRRIKSAGPMVSELRNLDVPARVYGGEGFYARQEISDLAAALYVLVKPEDALARLTLIRSPLLSRPDSALMDWKQPLPDLFDELRESLSEISVANIIDRLLLEGGYAKAIAAESDADQCLANLLKLRNMFVDCVEDYEEKISRLWENLDKMPKESLAEPFVQEEQAIQIMTMHQSKGLEFKVVILADLDSTQPSDMDPIAFDSKLGLAVTHKNRPLALCAPQSSDEKKEFPAPIDAVRFASRLKSEKELPRLLYVSLTRAKEAVYIIETEKKDRGLSLMRLIKQAKEYDKILFESLMPAHHPQHS